MTTENQLNDLILVTLSFFEPMTFSQIILDFDNDLLTKFPNFDKETLEESLGKLEQKKLIKRVTIDKEVGWIRIHPKRSFWRRLFETSWFN